MFVQRERRERRLLHGSFDRPMRGAVQLNRALRDEIGIFSRLVCEPVKQFMELGESRALQVPMRLFVCRRQGRHVREVQIQPPNESFLQIPIYRRRLLTPLRPLQRTTFGPHEGGTPHEPCAPGGQPFPNRNSPSAAARNLAIAREMQKSVYTHTCMHPAWNLSYSRSSPIRRVVGSWRRSGQASAPCTPSWKPWTFSNRASRGTFASSTRQGSCACGRRAKSASTRCARSHSASWTNGCDNTAACGRPASTGSAPNSINGRRLGQETAGRLKQDKQPEDGEWQRGEHRAKNHHVPDIQRSGRGSREAICLDIQELQGPRAGARGGGRSDRERAGAERDVRTRRSAVHGHGRRPVLHVRARDFPLRQLRDAGRDRPVVGTALRRRRTAALRLAQG